MKRETMKEKRENKLYTKALVLHGNNKLRDFTDDNGTSYKYAQVNTRAVIDCPFKSAGCTAVCYATKGNHVFPSVKESREKSYNETRRADFAEALIYTIEVEKTSKRYADAIMLVRVHESGDFYHIDYLKKFVKIWDYFTRRAETYSAEIRFPLYTKSFPLFNMLTDAEKDIIRKAMDAGVLAISASLDDTTTPAQKIAYLKMQADYPLLNVYYCTENIEKVPHDNVCDCADCAACGTCNKATGKKTVVKIHSASNDDIETYRKSIVA